MKKRDEWLWAVRVTGLNELYWIIAGPSLISAHKKAERFLAKLARKNNSKPYQIKSIKSRGTIDVF